MVILQRGQLDISRIQSTFALVLEVIQLMPLGVQSLWEYLITRRGRCVYPYYTHTIPIHRVYLSILPLEHRHSGMLHSGSFACTFSPRLHPVSSHLPYAFPTEDHLITERTLGPGRRTAWTTRISQTMAPLSKRKMRR